MHRSSRSPPSASSLAPGDPLDLSLSGSQLSVSRRPGSAVAAGKAFTRSVSVAADSKGKRNTLVSPASPGGGGRGVRTALNNMLSRSVKIHTTFLYFLKI